MDSLGYQDDQRSFYVEQARKLVEMDAAPAIVHALLAEIDDLHSTLNHQQDELNQLRPDNWKPF